MNNEQCYTPRKTFSQVIQASGVPSDGLTLEEWGKRAYKASKVGETK